MQSRVSLTPHPWQMSPSGRQVFARRSKITAQSKALFYFERQIILGLLIGGGIAAPMTRKLPLKTLMILVGALIIILSIQTIYLALR